MYMHNYKKKKLNPSAFTFPSVIMEIKKEISVAEKFDNNVVFTVSLKKKLDIPLYSVIF